VVATLALTGHGAHDAAPHRPQVLAETPFGRGDAAAALAQTVTVDRGAGALTVAMTSTGTPGELDITVTDTRADDVGWELTTPTSDAQRTPHLRTTAIQVTPSFSDATRFVYTQRVSSGHGRVVAAAPAGHGLGIAHIRAIVSSPATPLSDIALTAV